MRIRALSVFEGVVYHCWPVDRTNPGRPTLEVDALLREGDADSTSGPLLVTVADYIAMVGSIEVARPCLEQLQAKGRIVDRLGAAHISFPTWTRVLPAEPPADPTETPDDPTREPDDPTREPGDPTREPGDPTREPGDPRR